MVTIEEIGKVVFADKYWQGGNGGNFKAPYNNKPPKPYTEAIKNRFICGVIPEYVVLVDYDDPEAFECRLKIARELKQHCVVIKSPNKGGHFFWFNTQHQSFKSNSGNKTILTLHPVDYKCGIRACLVSFKNDTNKSQRNHLKRVLQKSLAIFPKPSVFVKPSK